MGESKPAKPPFWTTLPGILTGAAAVITALTGLLVALTGAGIIGGSGGATGAPASSQSGSVTAGNGGGASGAPAVLTGCLTGFFAADEPARVQAVEAGAQTVPVIAGQMPKAPPFGVVITEAGQPVAALRLQFIAGGDVFRVLGAVTATCTPVAGLRNVDRPGDPTVLQNFDTVRVPVMGKAYDIRLGASSALEVSVVTVAP